MDGAIKTHKAGAFGWAPMMRKLAAGQAWLAREVRAQGTAPGVQAGPRRYLTLR